MLKNVDSVETKSIRNHWSSKKKREQSGDSERESHSVSLKAPERSDSGRKQSYNMQQQEQFGMVTINNNLESYVKPRRQLIVMLM